MTDTSKKDYADRLDAKLREWSADIKKLKDAAGISETMIKEEYHKMVDDLQSRSEDLKKRLLHLREESGEVWDELRFGTENAWKEMKEAIEKARKRVSS